MTDVKDVIDVVVDKRDEVKAAAAPAVEKAVTWRDAYLQWVAAHPKTVSVVLAVALVWAAVATIKV